MPTTSVRPVRCPRRRASGRGRPLDGRAGGPPVRRATSRPRQWTGRPVGVRPVGPLPAGRGFRRRAGDEVADLADRSLRRRRTDEMTSGPACSPRSARTSLTPADTGTTGDPPQTSAHTVWPGSGRGRPSRPARHSDRPDLGGRGHARPGYAAGSGRGDRRRPSPSAASSSRCQAPATSCGWTSQAAAGTALSIYGRHLSALTSRLP